MMLLGYLGIDQHGTNYNIDKYPLKELKEQTGYTSHDIMYCDTKSGKIRKKGYVLKARGFNQLWINVYKVCDWDN